MKLWTAPMSSQKTFQLYKKICRWFTVFIFGILMIVMIVCCNNCLQLRGGWSLGVWNAFIGHLMFVQFYCCTVLLIDCCQSFSLSGWDVCSGAVFLCCLLIYGCAASFRGWHAESWYNSCYFICLSITLHLHTIQLHKASPSYMYSIHDSMCVQYTCLDTSLFASMSFTGS